MKTERLNLLRIITVVIGIIFAARLYNLQIINGEAYLAASNARSTAVVKEKAPRGDIKDRNGKNLVTNRKGYSLLWVKTAATDEEVNEMLFKAADILAESGYEFSDSLPISQYPFEYTFSDEAEREEWFKGKKRLSDDMTAGEVIEFYRDKVFKITGEHTNEQLRTVIGIRYDAEMNGFSYATPYTLATDVDIEVVLRIKEQKNDFQDIEVTTEYFRQYEFGSLAAHTLGRIGKIYKEEYDSLKEKGYAMNDYVGKQGIEKICEDDLRGTDGRKVLGTDNNGELPGVDSAEAVAGNYVVLTIDSDLQMAAEQSLKSTIEQIAANGVGKGQQKGADANAGAVVVLDVNNAEVLAMATYPSYNPETYNSMYSELSEDESKPLWNRAISGTYSPGSTFKPLTAIAALETGAVTIDEKLICNGVYKYFKDYQPRCWINLEHGLSHGWENVTEAIEDSCNLYFYEAGRRTGIEALSEYAKKFGLGEYTGIELTEESKGNMATPSYKEEIEGDGVEWYGGDTIQAAIGQSYSHFSPLQLANYIATLANGGTRYRPHIIKSVHRASDGAEVKRSAPIVEEKIPLNEENLAAVKRGMYGVVDEGSASKIFKDYDIEVGGKTGTAQGSSKQSNTALFVAFAPYDKPEIAVAVVIEHGVRGVNAATVARDVFDEYFGTGADETEIYDVGELIP